MEDQVKASLGAKHVDNKLLQTFTIPKIKRSADKFCLLHCTPNRREYGEILDTLNNGRLNMASELRTSWIFSEIKLVINNCLTERFFEKRHEMKELGRHNRELEDKFSFIVVPRETAIDIAQHSLSVGSTTTKELGNPQMGVYLFRHIDVALKFARRKKMSSCVVLIFKVLFGKIKTVKPRSAPQSIMDPTPNFDSHISKKPPVWNDPFEEQVTNSLIYVYEYDSNTKPVKSPRQCLPIAAVDATFIMKKAITATVPVRMPSKPISPGNTKPASCTVVKRIGKGKDAMVIYKSARPPFVQSTEIQINQSNVSDKEAPSVPVIETEKSVFLEKTHLSQNNITLPDLSISLQQHNVALESLITPCMLITSKYMKDPRLLKRSNQETLKSVGQQNQHSDLFENEVPCNIEPCEENVWNLEESINKTSWYSSFEERRVQDSFVMTKEPFMKGFNKYSSFLTYIEKERDSNIESLANLSIEEKAEHFMNASLYDQLYRVRPNQLETENILKTESAVNMTLSMLNSTNETSENGGKSKENLNPEIGHSSNAQYLSLSRKEREAGIKLLPNISCEEKTQLSLKQSSNDKVYKMRTSTLDTARSQQNQFISSDCTKESSENGEKFNDNRYMAQNLNNRDNVNKLYLSLDGKEGGTGIELLPSALGEEKLELSKKLVQNDTLYTVHASQLENEKSQQTHLSDLISVESSKETNKNGRKSEMDRQISLNQQVRNKETARAPFLLFKEKNKEITYLPNKFSEDKEELSKKLQRYDKFYKIHSNQRRTERNQATQVSESLPLNTSNNTMNTGENAEESEVNQSMSKKTEQQNKDTSTSFLSNKRMEKDKEIEFLTNTSNVQALVVDSISLKTSNKFKETNENGGKSEGDRFIYQNTMLKNKATERTISSVDCYKKQFLNPQIRSLKDISSVTSKTKLKKSKECVTGVKQRSNSADKFGIHKSAPQSSEKVPQNEKRQCKPVKKCHEIPEKINLATNKIATSIDDSPSPQKCVSSTAHHEKIKYLNVKEKFDFEKSPGNESLRPYEPRSVTEKTEECTKGTTASPKQITLDICDNIFTLESLTYGLDTKTKSEKEDFVLHSPNKINSETSRRDESLHVSHSCSIISSREAGMLCTDLDESVLHSKKMLSQALIFPKNTIENVSDEDLCLELKKRIDWNSIFGMELEKVNATLGTLQCSSVKQVRDPSGMRIFPDMEITIANNHYLCAGCNSNNIAGEMKTSIEAISKRFADFNDVPQDLRITDSLPRIEITTESPILQGSKNLLKDNLDPLSMKVDNGVQSNEKALISSQVTLKTAVDTNLNIDKTLHKINQPTLVKKLNKKRVPSVLVKRSNRRIRKFSQSEENIKVVLGMLSDEIPLCRNKRISKKLDRAVLHLRKAHKRVQKSLQLVAKAGERRNLSKSYRVLKNDSVNGKEVNAKQVESSSNRTEDSSLNTKAAEIPKSPTGDGKCLTESTQVMIKGASIQDFEHTKEKCGSAAKMSLSPSSKVNVCCSETPENQTSFSNVIVSGKENTVAVVAAPKTPSDGKERHALNCKTHRKYCMLRDCGRKRRHASKQIFSQVRKLSLSLSKYSNKKSHTINEKNRPNGKKMKDFASITTKRAKTSGLSLNKLSNILQKASETDSLKSLQNYSLVCQKMIPSFIKSFEKKQRCVLKDVIVDRKLFVKENLKTCFRCTLKPQAIEAFLELQMVMEISQFVENRMHYIEGKPTFRSLLWYDGSLYTELLSGESGYQQQSNFYSAFQEKLKLNPLTTLENHYYQLSEYLQEIDEKYSSYYVYLKYKRELQECDDVLKHKCDYTVFSLSVPFSCGVHLGDTIDDLTVLQKSTLEIIRTFINLPKCDQGKKEHAFSLLEVISAKIDYIKTSVSTSLQLSLFGIEHLLFDAAKIMAFNERKKYCGQRRTITKELISQINSIALSKLYEHYCEQPVSTKNSSSSEILNPHQSSEVIGNYEVLFFGKVIDQAQCAEPGVLKKVIQNCNQHLEFQSKCFQIIQECKVDEVIIQETNVLDMAERQDKHTTRLKSEAVEAYIDLAMTYETLHFLNCLVASKNNQMRTRGLLWYDTSLFSDLIHNQSRVQSLLQGHAMPCAMDLIDRTISEIKSELDVISNCSNSVNYTYAFQIMTRELSELSELKNFMKSKPAIATYINFSPFVASLHFGNSLTDLNYNYNQLSDYLEVLLSTSKKDLGKMAHTLKIMKTIEFIKVLALKPGISSFDFITCNVLHNRKKHSQTLKRPTQEKKQIQNRHSFQTRTKVFTEDSTPSSSKKPKVLPSLEKLSIKEKEQNQVKSDIRPRKVFAPRYKDQHPVRRDCAKGSPQKKSKLCFHTNSNYRKEYEASASEVIRINGKDSKSSPLDQYKIKKLDSLAGKCQEASATTDTFKFTLDSKDQPQADSKCVYTSCPESIISIGSEHENASKPSDVPDNNLSNEFSEQKDSPSKENLSNLSVCSMDTNTSEEQENRKELKSATGEQEEMEKNIRPIGTQEFLKNESTNWNNWPFSTAHAQYPQFPAHASSWQCSLYNWYQNGNNTGGVTQGYPRVPFNTKSNNPYNSSSAFPLPNPYITNQTYPGFCEQIQAPMYSVAGPFGANMLYNYTDPSSSSTQNPVPMPYSYSSAGWPWGSWQ